MNIFSTQHDSTFNVFQVNMQHHDVGVEHISKGQYITVTLSETVSGISTEWGDYVSNTNSISFYRPFHGNAYQSGDFSGGFKVTAYCADHAQAERLSASLSWSCDKTVNVQGKGGDE